MKSLNDEDKIAVPIAINVLFRKRKKRKHSACWILFEVLSFSQRIKYFTILYYFLNKALTVRPCKRTFTYNQNRTLYSQTARVRSYVIIILIL